MALAVWEADSHGWLLVAMLLLVASMSSALETRFEAQSVSAATAAHVEHPSAPLFAVARLVQQRWLGRADVAIGATLPAWRQDGLFRGEAPSAPFPGTEISERQLRALRIGYDSPGATHHQGHPYRAALRIGSPGATRGSPTTEASGLGVNAGEVSLLSIDGRFGLRGDSPNRGDLRGVLRLADVFGTEYVGFIGVGATSEGGAGAATAPPEVRLQVVFDTGSSDLWVASDLCAFGACFKWPRQRYNHSRSLTFHAPRVPTELRTIYGSGEYGGRLGMDDVCVGPLCAHGQTMGLISNLSGAELEQLPIDGIVGLGFPALASESMEPFVDTLMRQGSLPTREFAFFLHPDASVGGAVLWGSVDSRLLAEPLRWFPVVERSYWILELVSLRVGNCTLLEKSPEFSPRLAVDSGTTFFTAPAELLKAIRKQVGRSAPCGELGRLPPLVYTLRDVGGRLQEVAIEPTEYMVTGLSLSGRCKPGFIQLDLGSDLGTPLLILGEVFMRHRLTTFRREGRWSLGRARIGIARSNRKREDVDAFFADADAIGKP